MPELSLIEILKNAFSSLIDSKALVLVVLEIAILMIMLVFSKIMNKKVVYTTSLIASFVVLGFYVTNYLDTIGIFLNNVSTRLIEFLYFPTTLEFVIVMVVSFIIMGITYLDKKSNKFLKLINTILPMFISFLFLCIIEYINNNNIAFDEFSVFTNPVLMSLYELAMGIFILWFVGLIIYKIDLFILSRVKTTTDSVDDLVTIHLPKLKTEEEIEMPRLKAHM